MDENNKLINNEERYIIKYVWIYAFVIALILFFISDFKLILSVSFLLGAFTSLLGFTLTIKCVDKLIAVKELNAKTELMKCNVKKILIYTVVLIIAAYSFSKHRDEKIYLNVFATFAGLLSVKIVILFKEFVIDKIIKKDKENVIKKQITEVNETKDNPELIGLKKEVERLQKEIAKLEEGDIKNDN